MMVYVPLSLQDVALIARMYANGRSVKDIAFDTGASPTSIYRHLSLLKVGTVGPGKSRAKKLIVVQEQAYMDWLLFNRFTITDTHLERLRGEGVVICEHTLVRMLKKDSMKSSKTIPVRKDQGGTSIKAARLLW